MAGGRSFDVRSHDACFAELGRDLRERGYAGAVDAVIVRDEYAHIRTPLGLLLDFGPRFALLVPQAGRLARYLPLPLIDPSGEPFYACPLCSRETPMPDDGSWSISAAEADRMRQRPEAFGTRGMVASAHPVAAFIGLTILQRGGNAFDAAIAVAAAEGVLLPMKCGLGGDAFVVLHDGKKREMVAFNGSGVAGTYATADYYRSRGHKSMPLKGVHSIGVPGAVSVYEAFWKRYCTMPWAELWAPAIRLAEDGLAITAYISARYAEEAETLARYPHSAAQYLPNGRAPVPGERWAAPNLAKTLKAVAKGGADVFYRGEIAEKLVAFLRQEGALFEADDFARQQAVTYTPIRSDYRGLTVLETAPPSQGFLLLE